MNIFPNPGKDKISIQFDASFDGECTLHIYSIGGKLFKTIGRIQGDQVDVQISDWDAGFYLLKLFDVSGQTIAGGKLIKE